MQIIEQQKRQHEERLAAPSSSSATATVLVQAPEPVAATTMSIPLEQQQGNFDLEQQQHHQDEHSEQENASGGDDAEEQSEVNSKGSEMGNDDSEVDDEDISEVHEHEQEALETVRQEQGVQEEEQQQDIHSNTHHDLQHGGDESDREETSENEIRDREDIEDSKNANSSERITEDANVSEEEEEEEEVEEEEDKEQEEESKSDEEYTEIKVVDARHSTNEEIQVSDSEDDQGPPLLERECTPERNKIIPIEEEDKDIDEEEDVADEEDYKENEEEDGVDEEGEARPRDAEIPDHALCSDTETKMEEEEKELDEEMKEDDYEEDKKDEEEEDKGELSKPGPSSLSRRNLEIRRMSATDEGNKILDDAWDSPEKEESKSQTPLEMVQSIISNIDVPVSKATSGTSSPSSGGKASPLTVTTQPPGKGRAKYKNKLPLLAVPTTIAPWPQQLQQQSGLRPKISSESGIPSSQPVQIQPMPSQQPQQAPVMQLVNTINGPMLMQAMPMVSTAGGQGGILQINAAPMVTVPTSNIPTTMTTSALVNHQQMASGMFQGKPILKKRPRRKKTSLSDAAEQQKQSQQQPQAQQQPSPVSRANPVPILMSPSPSSSSSPQLVAINHPSPGSNIIATATGPSGHHPQAILPQAANFVLNQAGQVVTNMPNQMILSSNGTLMSLPTMQAAPSPVVLNQLPDGTFYQVQTQAMPAMLQGGQQLITGGQFATGPFLVNPTGATQGGQVGTFIMTPQGLVQAAPAQVAQQATLQSGTPPGQPSTPTGTGPGPMLASPAMSQTGSNPSSSALQKRNAGSGLAQNKKRAANQEESDEEDDEDDEDDDSESDEEDESEEEEDEEEEVQIIADQVKKRRGTSNPKGNKRVVSTKKVTPPSKPSQRKTTASSSYRGASSSSTSKRRSPESSHSSSSLSSPTAKTFLQSNQVDSSGLKATPPHTSGDYPTTPSKSESDQRDVETSGGASGSKAGGSGGRKRRRRRRNEDELIKEALLQSEGIDFKITCLSTTRRHADISQFCGFFSR